MFTQSESSIERDKKIMEVIKKNGNSGIRFVDLCAETGEKASVINSILRRFLKTGAVERIDVGLYSMPSDRE